MNSYCQMITNKLLKLDNLRPQMTCDQKWVNMRCPLCGDSKKDYNKKRFYVKVELDEDELMPYYKCFNCGAGGSINNILGELFNNDYNIESETNLYYKKIALNPKAKKFKMRKKREVVIKKPIAIKHNVEKLHYLNNRLGIKLTMSDIVKCKIIVDLYQFLHENKIKSITRDKRVADLLETDYVGFMTVNNDHINMRNFRDSHKGNKYLKRYESYDIFGNTENLLRMYIISNTINIMEDIEIIVAEGPIDILGVYNHIYHKDDKNRLFVAVCGSGYLNVIKNVITEYGVLFSDIKIYSDNESEKNLDFYRDLKYKLGEKINSMTVYYNRIGKDFGVRKEEIECHGITI